MAMAAGGKKMGRGARVPGSGTLIKAEESGARPAFRPGSSDVAGWVSGTWRKASSGTLIKSLT